MTVGWRRSADGRPGIVASGFAPAVPAAAPQLLQKRLFAGLLLPQAPHNQGSVAPQSPQNLSPGPTPALQRGHTRPVKLAVIQASIIPPSMVQRNHMI
jgi:hypothetical protein